jgi:UDP-glucose 4-epimerase
VKILLTGATGFIGRRLAAELSRRHELVAVGRGRRETQVEWIEQDLALPLNLAALPQRLDAVIHLAQSRRYREFPDGAEDMFSINVRSTLSLLEHARAAGAKTFLFASTGGIYAHSYDALVETDPVLPLDFYLTSKHVAEQLIGNYRNFFHTVVFRFFFVYGPGQRRMLVPTLAERVLRGETVTVEGMPGLRINPIYVEDAIRVFEPALTLGSSDLFNVAGEEVVALDELVRMIGRMTGRDALLEHAPANDAGDLVGDNARMKSVLGVEPRVTLEAGLAATCAELAP